MPRPRDRIPKASQKAFRCTKIDLSEAACNAAPTGEGLGQRSSVCHWRPSRPWLASSAFFASMSRGTSALLCRRLHITAGKSCGINQRCAARRPMGALRSSALCSLRLSATPPGLCLGSPKSSRRNGWRGMAGTKAAFCSLARSYLVLAALAMFSSRPTALTKNLACSLSKANEPKSLVMARPAGFSCGQLQS